MTTNTFKTLLLLGILTGILLFLGNLFGGREGLTIALLFALLMNVFTFWFSDKIVLAIYGAKEIKPDESPNLHQMVHELAVRAGIPKPRVCLIDSPQPNAFATGRNPSNSCVAVTKGLLNLLEQREIRGVIAHEIAHIKNRDILIQTVAAIIAGAITYLAYMARWALILGGSRDSRERSSPINLIAFLLISILAPLAATLIHLAISRSREYDADYRGALISKDPLALASALRKLGSYTRRIPMENVNPATSHMFIVSPLRGQEFFSNLFSTHPPIEERIRRLENLAKNLNL